VSVPAGASEVSYGFTVSNPDEVFNDRRVFQLAPVSDSVWSLQQTNDAIEAMMDSYLEDINLTYPASGGYTVDAFRSYTCQNVEGDTWPTP
jgi:hypothetical protein